MFCLAHTVFLNIWISYKYLKTRRFTLKSSLMTSVKKIWKWKNLATLSLHSHMVTISWRWSTTVAHFRQRMCSQVCHTLYQSLCNTVSSFLIYTVCLAPLSIWVCTPWNKYCKKQKPALPLRWFSHEFNVLTCTHFIFLSLVFNFFENYTLTTLEIHQNVQVSTSS